MNMMSFRKCLVVPVILAVLLFHGFTACNWPEQQNEQIGFAVTNTEEWTKAMNHIRASSYNQNYIITINGDIDVPGGVDPTFGNIPGLSVTLQGNGTLSLNSRGNMIRLALHQTLLIDSADLILQGLTNNENGANEDNNTAVVYLATTTRLILRNGTICGNTNGNTNSSGGGIYIDGGSFIMTGGAVSGNTADNGGGVYVYRAGASNNNVVSFSKSGGIIYGKDAAQDDKNTANADTYGHAVYYYFFISPNSHYYYRDTILSVNLSTGDQMPASGQTLNEWTKRN